MNDTRGVAFTILVLSCLITFVAFPFAVMPAMDGLVEWTARHG